jgi:hypothetical protein
MVAVELIHGKPQVQSYRIEPTAGITDPAKFNANFGSQRIKLIQDNALFYSAVVSYGCMGIVTGYILKVVPEYWLRESKELLNWPEVRDRLRQGTIRLPDGLGEVPRFAADDNHFWFLLNVAEMQGKFATENAACLLFRRNVTEARTQPKIWLHRNWPPERHKAGFDRVVQHKISRKPDKEHDKLGEHIRNLYFETEAGRGSFMDDRTESVSYIAHRRERDRTATEGPDPPPEAISMELAVDAVNVVDAITLAIETIRRSEYFFSVPLGVRFTPPSKHILSPAFDRASAFVEVPFRIFPAERDTKKNLERRKRMREEDAKPALGEVEKAFRDTPALNTRAHLGKHQTMGREQLERLYPRFSDWLAAFLRFNPVGTFDNDFARARGLR